MNPLSLSKAIALENDDQISISGDEVRVDINYNNNGNSGAKAYLDYIEVIGKKRLEGFGSSFSFRNFF